MLRVRCKKIKGEVGVRVGVTVRKPGSWCRRQQMERLQPGEQRVHTIKRETRVGYGNMGVVWCRT